MPSGIINLALGLAIQVGSPGPSETPNAPFPQRAFGQYGFEGSSEPRITQESQMNWLHGYHQEIPAYGGHHVFRPYNYKDVLSQSQTAAGWGERPSMPYSQQFWHKYQDQATMLKLTRNQVPQQQQYLAVQQMTPQGPVWVAQPSGIQVPAQQVIYSQPGPAAIQNTILVPSNMTESIQLPAVPSTSEFNQLGYRKEAR